MRVAITLEQCWHRVPGGTAVAALSCVEALRRLDDPPELVGVSAWHRQPDKAALAPAIPITPVRLPRAILYWGWHRWRWPRLERSTGLVDVVHATGMAIPPSAAPLIVTVNDLAFLRYPDHATRRGSRFFLRSLELTRKEADLVVCPSQHTADDCLKAGIEADRIRVVPYWTSPDLEPPTAAEDARQKFGLTKPFVLWIGTAEPRKNLDNLLAAWQMLGRTDEELVLVGPRGWGIDVEKATAFSAPPVRWLGFVSEADKRALLRAASVLCYPSLTEGFGLPVLEAMVQAVPVVTSQQGATAEVAGPTGVLVDPHSPAEIAAALAALLDDPEAGARRGEQGRHRALAEFTWQHTAGALRHAYEELAG